MLSYESALSEILARTSPLPTVRVPLEDAAGRVLAETIHAPSDLPTADLSLMDGYAVRAAEAGAGATLTVAFEIAAGRTAPRPLGTGECARIFTGAPLPEGADAVVMQERVHREGSRARFDESTKPVQHVRRRAEELSAGTVALETGTLLDPGEIALAATCGQTHLAVHGEPRCAVLATGDELLPLGSTPGPGQIIESNSYALVAMARAAGANAQRLSLERDDAAAISAKLATDAEIVVTSGGASVGDFDFGERALAGAGGNLIFHQVAIRPGKPTLFGILPGGRLFFGLPGNPAAAMLTFELFVRPALRRLCGDGHPERPRATARLVGQLARPPGFALFPRGRAQFENGALTFRPSTAQSSMQIGSWRRVNAIAQLPPGPGDVRDDDPVEVHLLEAPGP